MYLWTRPDRACDTHWMSRHLNPQKSITAAHLLAGVMLNLFEQNVSMA